MRLSVVSTTPTLLSASKKMPPGLVKRVSSAIACSWAVVRFWSPVPPKTPMMRAADRGEREPTGGFAAQAQRFCGGNKCAALGLAPGRLIDCGLLTLAFLRNRSDDLTCRDTDPAERRCKK